MASPREGRIERDDRGLVGSLVHAETRNDGDSDAGFHVALDLPPAADLDRGVDGGGELARLEALGRQRAIPVRTLGRWRQWHETFPQTRLWRATCCTAFEAAECACGCCVASSGLLRRPALPGVWMKYGTKYSASTIPSFLKTPLRPESGDCDARAWLARREIGAGDAGPRHGRARVHLEREARDGAPREAAHLGDLPVGRRPGPPNRRSGGHRDRRGAVTQRGRAAASARAPVRGGGRRASQRCEATQG